MDILQKYMLHALLVVHTVLPQCRVEERAQVDIGGFCLNDRKANCFRVPWIYCLYILCMHAEYINTHL